MWIFTNEGMISVVQHRDQADKFMIRARRSEHLEAIFPNEQIYRTDAADYRFRVIVDRGTAVAVVANKMFEIRYDNFKNSIRDAEYHDACSSVWGVMLRMQSTPGSTPVSRKEFDDFIDGDYLNRRQV